MCGSDKIRVEKHNERVVARKGEDMGYLLVTFVGASAALFAYQVKRYTSSVKR